MKNTIKNFEEYFNVNEGLFDKKEKTPFYKNGGDEGEMEIESEDEIYASKLGLKGCKIIGACDIEGGIKLKLKDSSSDLCYVNITIKNGVVNLYTNYEYDNDDNDDEDG